MRHRTITDAKTLVATAEQAAFAIDQDNRITAWNRGAEWLLGYRSRDVVHVELGQRLAMRDGFGNRACPHLCAVHAMVAASEPIHPFEIDVRHADGRFVRVRALVTTVLGSPRPGYELILVLEEIRQRRRTDPEYQGPPPPAPGEPQARETLAPNAAAPRLTERETEVLRHLARGMTAKEVAHALGIETTTARNHVQRILRKLDVRTRTAAVAMALRHRLI